MSTAIENFLYGASGTHGVVEMVLSANRFVVSLAPWTTLAAVKVAEFMEPKITSINVYADNPDDLNLPWDIIGFDSYPLPVAQWWPRGLA